MVEPSEYLTHPHPDAAALAGRIRSALEQRNAVHEDWRRVQNEADSFRERVDRLGAAFLEDVDRAGNIVTTTWRITDTGRYEAELTFVVRAELR